MADCADDGHSNVTENFFKVVEDEQKVYLLRGYATYVGVKSIEVREGGRPHFALHRPRNGEVYLNGENERSLSRFISGLVTFFCGLLIRQSGDAVSLRKVTACLTDVGREMRCPSVRHFVLALPLPLFATSAVALPPPAT